MKCIVRMLLTVFAIGSGLAAQQLRASPEEELRNKLASPFLKRAKWTMDYPAALAEAKQRDCLIFAYFTTAGY